MPWLSRLFLALTMCAVAGTGACTQADSRDEASVSTKRLPASTYTVTTTDDSGSGSLRQAILDANAAGEAATIAFAIPGPGPHVITPLTPLPEITAPSITVDGLTQPGASCATWPATLKIVLDGSAISAAYDSDITLAMLKLRGGSAVVRGLVIGGVTVSNQSGSAIRIASDGNRVQCNFLGTDATGLAPHANNVGVYIESGSANVVGVDGDGVGDASERNLLGSHVGSSGAGVRALGGAGTVIAGNWIGVDASGLVALPTEYGVEGSSDGLRIGTNADGTSDLLERNVIGADRAGIYLSGVHGARISGNHIGVDQSGSIKIAGGGTGIRISDSKAVVIGTDGDGVFDAIEGNVISGNDGFPYGGGIESWSICGTTAAEACRIAGNKIGTDATGTAPIPNLFGIKLTSGASNHVVGTNADGVSDALERNVIAGNDYGIRLGGGSEVMAGNVIAGNYLGTNAAGTAVVPGGSVGIHLQNGASGTHIGTFGDGSPHDAARANVIAGHGFAGIHLVNLAGFTLDATRISGNRIGVAADGVTLLGNQIGVLVRNGGAAPTNTWIGGPGALEGNVIAGNAKAGVVVEASVEGVRVQRNSFFGNRLAIDLGDDGPTPNAPTNPVPGAANRGQNHPVVTKVTPGASSTTVEGTLTSAPSTTYTIEIYDNTACNASGHGEARTFLGTATVTTDASGVGTFSTVVPVVVTGPHRVTLTATDPDGNTSEVSRCWPSPAATTTTITSVTPSTVDAGQPVTVSVDVAPSAGAWGTPTGTVIVGDGAASCTITLAGGAGSCAFTPGGVGTRTITASYSGDVFFAASSATSSVTVQGSGTTTTLSSSPNPASVGEPVTFVAQVVASGSTPTGEVVFGGFGSGCTAPLSGGVASCTTIFTAPGSYTITASYSGDAGHSASSATPITQVVTKGATTTTLTGTTPNPSNVGQSVTVSFTVSASHGTPSGTVTIRDGATAICSGTLVDGSGSCTVSSLSVGTHSLVAEYEGDASYAPSTSGAVTHVVSAAASTTTITSVTPSPATAGAAVTVSVSVASTPTATGSVVISAGSKSCTATLTAGEGSCSFTPTSAGTVSIVATYAGDGLVAGSTSAPTSLVVQPAAASTIAADAESTPQTTTVATAFAKPLRVTVRDAWSNVVPNATVVFQAASSGPTASLSATTVTTDASGVAQVTATAGTVAGSHVVTATISGTTTSTSFALTNVAGAPAAIAANAGSTPQSATIETAFAKALAVTVRDAHGNPVEGATVDFAAPTTGPSAILSVTSATTDASGVAQTSATANAVAGSYAVTATIAGTTTSTSFSLENVAGAPGSITADAESTPQSATVATAFAKPLAVTVRDALGNPVSGVTVTFTVPTTGATATLAAATAVTASDGVAQVGATAGTVAGSYTVTASAPGVTAPASFALENLAGAPASVTVSSTAATQSAATGAAFPSALVVTVRDEYGNPVPGVTVTFAAPATGPTATLSATTATTDASGEARVTATAGTVAGSYTVTATVEGVSTPGTFSLTNLAGEPGSITANAGSTPQTATVGTAFANPLAVTVRDASGNPIAGVTVTFGAPATGATATLGATTATTGDDGVASVSATAGTVAGTYDVTATVAGTVAPATFTLTNAPGAPASLVAEASSTPQSATVGTAFAKPLVVTVLDASGNAVPGVTVTWAAPASGATAVLDASTSTTDASGIAQVNATAGTASGAYSVTASVTGVETPATFALENLAGAPGSITADGPAATQTTTVDTAFAHALAAVVRDAHGNPVAGVTVTFTAGTSSTGATAILSATTATTDASGVASVNATANGKTGTYEVTASASGVAAPATFALGNVAKKTTVTVDAPTTVVEGTPIEMTITVAGTPGTPTGTVVVVEGSTTHATVTLEEGTAKVTLPALPVGVHTLVARYEGDGSFAKSSATATITVTSPDAVEPGTDATGGDCGCEVVGHPGASRTGLLAAAALVALVVRRRRTAR